MDPGRTNADLLKFIFTPDQQTIQAYQMLQSIYTVTKTENCILITQNCNNNIVIRVIDGIYSMRSYQTTSSSVENHELFDHVFLAACSYTSFHVLYPAASSRNYL